MPTNQRNRSWTGKNSFLLLFVLLSVVIWTVTKLSNTYKTAVQLAVLIEEVPDSLSVRTVSEFTLNVEGSGLDLLLMHLSPKPIRIPFKSLTYEDQQLRLGALFQKGIVEAQFPESVRLLQWSLYPSRWQVDVLLTKKIPLLWELDLTFDSGYRLFEKGTIEPDSIWVSGDSNAVDSMTYWKLPTLRKQISHGPFTIETSIEEPPGLSLSATQFRYSGTALRFVEQRIELDIIPLGLSPDTRIRLYPPKAQLVYQIPLDAATDFPVNQLRLVADFKKRSVDKLQIPLELQRLPNRFIPVRIEPAQVQYLIRRD